MNLNTLLILMQWKFKVRVLHELILNKPVKINKLSENFLTSFFKLQY